MIFLKFLKCLNPIFAISLFNILCIPFVSSDPGYLRFCDAEEKEVVHSTSCTKGLWLNGIMKPNCVCAKGVWALSNGLCDKKTALIVGEDHCFHIGFDVKAVKFIGNPNDPFSQSVYSGPSDLDSLFEIPENGFTPPISSDPSLLIGINPRRTLQRSDKSVCIQLQEEFKWKPVHIYLNPLRSASNKWAYGTKAHCSEPKDFTYHVGFGEMYQDGKIHSKEFIGRDCFHQCPTLTPTYSARFGRAFGTGKGRSMKSINSTSINSGGIQNTITTNYTTQELIQEAQDQRARVQIDMEDYQIELNEQTIRLMHAQISPTLLGTKSDSINNYTREYEYFQKARFVVQNICPEDYVPRNLVSGLMRMFKRLLWESVDQSPHTQVGDDGQFNRIMEVLDNCTLNSQINETFSYINYTGTFNFSDPTKNESSPDWPKPEQCPEPLIYSIHGKKMNKNDTYANLVNATGAFHPHMKFNTTLVDFVIETAWKIVTIGHYHCSNSFNNLNAADFSAFFHQMELFFNNKIVKRWYDPISVQNTYKIIQLIFPTYDLKRFAFGIDLCLLGSQQFSGGFDWNSKWLQRPKIPFSDNELSQKKFLYPGLGSSLSTNDYAPKISRKKRDTIMWNGKAECMEEYSDPVKIFGYNPKPGCRVE